MKKTLKKSSYKVMVIVGTRPELIKLSCVFDELERVIDQTVLVHTGQNYDYELNQVFFEELAIRKPDYFLEIASGNPATDIGNVIAKVDPILEAEQPDAILLYGDTNSCLSVIPAKRRKIPIFHMEAGNRCFDQRVPEEINRKIVDHLSDINLPLTEHARRYLIDEGLNPQHVIKIGSPMREVLARFSKQIEASTVLSRLNLNAQQYFMVSLHREENVDRADRLRQAVDAIHHLANHFECPVIVSLHPRTRNRMERFGLSFEGNELVQFMKPLGFYDYVHLQQHSAAVISDSGTLTEEASILGFNGIMVRQAHERPEGMDVGVTIMSAFEPTKLLEAVSIIQQQNQRPLPSESIDDFKTERVSIKVSRIILSYIDHINFYTWHQPTKALARADCIEE